MIVLQYLPSATLFVMMFAMGLGLVVADFTRVLREPRAALLGLVGQLVALPVVALTIALWMELPEFISVGLLVIAVCPGGTTSNAFTFLARGDVALSISLTAVSSLVAFAWVPLVLGVGLRVLGLAELDLVLPFGETTLRLLGTTALPVLAGMAFRSNRAELAARLQRPLLRGSISVLMLLIAALPFGLMAEDVDLAALFLDATPAVALLLVSMLALAWIGGRALGVDATRRRTIAIEVAIQNFNLAMVLALSVLAEPRLMATAVVYLPAMLLLGTCLVWSGRRAAPSSKGACSPP